MRVARSHDISRFSFSSTSAVPIRTRTKSDGGSAMSREGTLCTTCFRGACILLIYCITHDNLVHVSCSPFDVSTSTKGSVPRSSSKDVIVSSRTMYNMSTPCMMWVSVEMRGDESGGGDGGEFKSKRVCGG